MSIAIFPVLIYETVLTLFLLIRGNWRRWPKAVHILFMPLWMILTWIVCTNAPPIYDRIFEILGNGGDARMLDTLLMFEFCLPVTWVYLYGRRRPSTERY